jgi:hypothetical protein
MSRGAACPAEPPTQADQTQTRLHSELPHNDPAIELPARACSTDMQKRLASCMIRVSHHPVAADITPETATHGIDIFIRTKSSYPKSCCYLFDRVEHLKYERGGEAPLHAYRRPRRFRHR